MRRLAVVAVVLWLSVACFAADCTKCGKPVPQGAQFCPSCGTKQPGEKPKPAPKAAPKPVPKPVPAPQPKSSVVRPAHHALSVSKGDVAGKGAFDPAWLAGLPNVLPNGGFENDRTGWHPWGQGKKDIDATGGRDGRAAARLESPPVVRQAHHALSPSKGGEKAHMQAYEQAVLAVLPGERYYVEAWCKGAEVTDNGGAYLMLVFQARRGDRWETVKDGSCKSKVLKGTTDWQRLAVHGTAPAEAERLVVQVVLNSHGTVWFDDVRLLRFVSGPRREAFDRAVGLAIAKGSQYLLATMHPEGHWEPYGQPYVDRDLKYGEQVIRTEREYNALAALARKRLKPDAFADWKKRTWYDKNAERYRVKMPDADNAHNYQFAGPTALAVYALLECGIEPKEPKVAKALAWLSGQRLQRTYSLALRANAFAAADRHERGTYKARVLRDARQLAASTPDGSYGYFSRGRFEKGHGWDNSNSQYGVLGVWAAAQVGVEIPAQVWRFFGTHWRRTQYPNGGWAYKYDLKADSWHNTPRGAMTLGGLASLFVCSDNTPPPGLAKCGQKPTDANIEAGLAWMEKNFLKDIEENYFYYYCYGVERVGLACGYKYFGKQDWYRLIAERLLERQEANGRWGGNTHRTAFALLFLTRGRNPVLFNKLRFDGDWNNRPRDLAQLTQWITYQFERPVNWQVINLQTEPEQWHDAPIIYLSGSRKFTLTDAEVAKLRRFVNQGGAIFSCTECRGRGFHDAIREVYKRMFPRYELTPCPPTHAIYSMEFKLHGRPRFEVVSNGVRPLVVHSDDDLPLAWQFRRLATARTQFEGPANVFMYLTDKGRLRGRGVSHWPERPATYAARAVRLARLKFDGAFDPEPLAYERFARLMRRDCQTHVDIVGPIAVSDLPAAGAKIATLTGVGALKLSAAEIKTLKDWTAAGGTLVIDAMGGSKAFYDSARALLMSMYGTVGRELALSAPVYQIEGFRIVRVTYRHDAKVRMPGRRTPAVRAVMVGDRPAVLFSREDISAGLLGIPASTIDGYDTASAFALMRNFTLHAAGLKAR